MALEKKERYIVKMEDGKEANALCQSFKEVVELFGEENIVYIRKLDYEEPEV